MQVIFIIFSIKKIKVQSCVVHFLSVNNAAATGFCTCKKQKNNQKGQKIKMYKKQRKRQQDRFFIDLPIKIRFTVSGFYSFCNACLAYWLLSWVPVSA